MRAIAAVVVNVIAGCAASGVPQDPYIAENAPVDCAATTTTSDLYQIIREKSPEALKTWPDAKASFLAGLPEKHSLFVTLMMADKDMRSEYLFLVVDEIEANEIRGRIWSDVQILEGIKFGDSLALSEDMISDWLITKPDGTEDGNLIGNYIDTLEQCSHLNDEKAEGKESNGT